MRFIPAVSPVQIQVPLPDARDAKASRVSYGPLVKWLRHGPFTAVTWVRIPYGSPSHRTPLCTASYGQKKITYPYGGLAQLVRAPASHAGGHWFESSSLHQEEIPGTVAVPGIFSSLPAEFTLYLPFRAVFRFQLSFPTCLVYLSDPSLFVIQSTE